LVCYDMGINNDHQFHSVLFWLLELKLNENFTRKHY